VLSTHDTDLGEVSLRRRIEPVTGQCIYEVKMDEDFLMSSLFTVAEEAMADLALSRLAAMHQPPRSVLVGGLGLGYTALAALRHRAVESLTVVELLQPVIDWHAERLLPCSQALWEDRRTTVVQADFFAAVAAGSEQARATFGAELDSSFDAVLLDIDHAPDHVLRESHQGFYSAEGLQRMCDLVRPGGIFALWSDRRPDPLFTERLAEVFSAVQTEVVSFANPLTRAESANTVYLASAPTAARG